MTLKELKDRIRLVDRAVAGEGVLEYWADAPQTWRGVPMADAFGYVISHVCKLRLAPPPPPKPLPCPVCRAAAARTYDVQPSQRGCAECNAVWREDRRAPCPECAALSQQLDLGEEQYHAAEARARLAEEACGEAARMLLGLETQLRGAVGCAQVAAILAKLEARANA